MSLRSPPAPSGNLLLASVSAVVATVLPAWRGSRLPIVDALRQAR